MRLLLVMILSDYYCSHTISIYIYKGINKWWFPLQLIEIGKKKVYLVSKYNYYLIINMYIFLGNSTIIIV